MSGASKLANQSGEEHHFGRPMRWEEEYVDIMKVLLAKTSCVIGQKKRGMDLESQTGKVGESRTKGMRERGRNSCLQVFVSKEDDWSDSKHNRVVQ